MTKEQVEMLRAAGISESAIIDRILGETKEEPEKKTEPEKKEEPEPEKKTEPEKKPEKKEEPEQKTEDKILKAIEKLTGAVLSRNINTIGRDDTPEESADDVLGSLFRGEPNKGGK